MKVLKSKAIPDAFNNGKEIMPKWMPCGEEFIVGGVVRRKEAVWVEKGKRKRKLIKATAFPRATLPAFVERAAAKRGS
jgi:hypothetical protein